MEAARFSSLGEKRFPGNDITMTMATTYLKMCRDDLRIQWYSRWLSSSFRSDVMAANRV